MTLRVRTLWLFGLTLSVGLGAGCGGGDGSDARIAVNWSVAYVGAEATTCDAAGTPTVRLEARRTSSQTYTFDFDCGPQNGISDGIPPGTYDVRLSLLDLKKRPVASTMDTFEIRRHGPTELAPVQFQVQAFQVQWLMVVVDPMSKAMRVPTCAEVGVKTVEFSAQISSDPAGETFRFDCLNNPGVGLTSAVRIGSYSYQFRLLDALDKPLTEGDIKPVVVGSPSQLTMVPSERFEFQ